MILPAAVNSESTHGTGISIPFRLRDFQAQADGAVPVPCFSGYNPGMSGVRSDSQKPGLPRSSGLLLHLTALPGRFGIGDLGPSARRFVDFLSRSGQTFWQILPFGPVDPAFDNSPYMSYSAFAGSSLLISPELLLEEGLVTPEDVENFPLLDPGRVAYAEVRAAKAELFRRAFSRSRERLQAEFEDFCRREGGWLDDYALFMVLKARFQGEGWFDWPTPFAGRDSQALAAARKDLAGEICFHQFIQFLFDRQWRSLKAYAADRKVQFMGDLPIYVAFDSADVWRNPRYFDLDPETRSLRHVAGVPPDYFSKTGQRWGNPLYLWRNPDQTPNRSLYDWWVGRLAFLFNRVDCVRIDHFRGFEAYWEVPAEHETAEFGRWVEGPGPGFFADLRERLGQLPIIAEDLGLITPEVDALREELGFPGMKVLHFAFDSGPENKYLPFNYEDPHFIVYTGTHDNDTTQGWFHNALDDEGRKRVLAYLGFDGPEIHWALIRYAMASTARVCIFPVQDVLGLGGESKMNVPGTAVGNWTWRLQEGLLNAAAEERLRELSVMFRRAGSGSVPV